MNEKTKAHTRYRLQPTPTWPKGEIVPGVTTILDSQCAWNKRVLIAWARKQALAGIDPDKVLTQAGDIGSIVHRLIEAHVKNHIEKSPHKYIAHLKDFSEADREKGKQAFKAYLEWEQRQDLEYIACEMRVISEQYRYGGTIDILSKRAGKLLEIDAKSSKGIWPEQKIQTIAYKYAFEETIAREGGDSQIDEIILLHLDKETGEFKGEHRLTSKEIESGWEVFKHLRSLYDLQKNFK